MTNKTKKMKRKERRKRKNSEANGRREKKKIKIDKKRKRKKVFCASAMSFFPFAFFKKSRQARGLISYALLRPSISLSVETSKHKYLLPFSLHSILIYLAISSSLLQLGSFGSHSPSRA